MATKHEKAVDKLRAILREAGETGVLKEEAWKILADAGLDPGPGTYARGRIVIQAGARKLGLPGQERYIHRDFVDQKRRARAAFETLEICPDGGTVTVKGPGVNSTFNDVVKVTIVRRRSGKERQK